MKEAMDKAMKKRKAMVIKISIEPGDDEDKPKEKGKVKDPTFDPDEAKSERSATPWIKGKK